MATGEFVCMVLAKAQIPIVEQRLYTGDRELSVDHAVLGSSCGSALDVLLLVRQSDDPRHSNVSHLRLSPADLRPAPEGCFTVVKRLADAIHGKVYLARWQHAGLEDERIVVKKMANERVIMNLHRETSEWNMHLRPKCDFQAEDALTEIGVFAYLAQQPDLPVYLLRSYGAFVDSRYTWLVTEFAGGGELFEHVAEGVRCDEPQLRHYIWQLLQAVCYLHKHDIGHRDISLENILVKDGTIRLMDFGMAAQTRAAMSAELIRYFRPVGKDTYRAPECYVPKGSEARVLAPRGACEGDVVLASTPSGQLCNVRLPPGSVPGVQCVAELWGYAIPPADIFSSGVAMFTLSWQFPPWRRAVAGGPLKDAGFAFYRGRGDGGLEAMLRNWKKPLLSPDAMKLLSRMTRPDPAERASIEECLANPWFAPLADVPVETHGSVVQA